MVAFRENNQMKLSDLTEGLSDILYHGTSIKEGANIILMNKFILKLNSPEERHTPAPSGKYYFLSTSRSRFNSFAEEHVLPLTFVLDGKTLSHNYKGKPAVYKLADKDETFDDTIYTREFEDRIFSDKPYIENAKKYIKEIHIHFNNLKTVDDYHDETQIKYIKFIKNNANKPVYIYTDSNDYLHQRKSKAVTSFKKEVYYNKGETSDELKHHFPQFHKPETHDPVDLITWIELLTYNDINSLSEKSLFELDRIFISKPISIMSMHLRVNVERYAGKSLHIDNFIKLMRKYKLNTYDDVVRYIYKKWLPFKEQVDREINRPK